MFPQHWPTEEETQAIRKLLEGIDFPPGIVSWRFELGDDWTGDPAAKIWLIVDEDVVPLKELARVLLAAERRIHDAFIAARIRRWPYVNARSEAEEREFGTLPQ